MREQFISEPLKPVTASSDTRSMSTGEPGLPGEFKWRKELIRVESVVRRWKETSPCRHGSGEKYVRKHWYEIRTDSGRLMKIYFERQARSRLEVKKRWWLFTIVDS